MEVLLFAFGVSTLLAIGAASLNDGVRHRAVGALAGAAFGVFGLAGLLGALLLIVVPAYRRATARREGGWPWRPYPVAGSIRSRGDDHRTQLHAHAPPRGSMQQREEADRDRPEEEP